MELAIVSWNDVGNWSNLAGVLSFIVPAVAFVYAWKTVRCRIPWCARAGKHKVDGTAAKVCDKHHTLKHHEFLYRRHLVKYPDRLAHGESHHMKLPPGEEHPHKQRSA